MKIEKKWFENFVAFLKQNGFVYPGSEIYDGLANSWDFGPMGAMLKENIKKEWLNHFVYFNKNSFLLNSSIILNSKVWEASGHIDKFNDPLIDCKNCKTRYRADNLLEDIGINIAGKTIDELNELILKHNVKCEKCKEKTDWTKVRVFELMFKVPFSKTTTNDDHIFLRPETAQGIFINFKNIINTVNKLPFGIGQIGKAFRNEITPGNFIFRTKEFEQMEYEYFVNPITENENFDKLVLMIDSFLKKVGLNNDDLFKKDIPKEELAHYSKKTIDYEFDFPFGKKELLGIANRGIFDLSNHSKFSGVNLSMQDENNEKVIPSIIEVSFGLERLMLAILTTSFNYDHAKERSYFALPFNLSPYKISICPLAKIHEEKAEELLSQLFEKQIWTVKIDKSGSIGKRYFKNDAMGTYFVITIDDLTLSENTVTIRNRNTTIQERINLNNLEEYINENGK